MHNSDADQNLGRPWEQTIPDFLNESIQNAPNKIFLELQGENISYKDFGICSRKAAEQFLEFGIEKGDRVCLFLDNCPEFLYAITSRANC